MITVLLLGLLAGPLSASPASAAEDGCTTTTTYTDRAATFRFPGKEGAHYDNNLKSCWNIAPKLREGERLALRVSTIDVEKGHDFLAIYGQATGALIDAEVDTDFLYYDTVGFTLRFTSDHDVTGKGFTVAWSVVASEPDNRTEEVEFKVALIENETQAVPASTNQALVLRRGAAWARSCGFLLDPTVGFEDEADARAEVLHMERACSATE
jgi:hypothetical protein